MQVFGGRRRHPFVHRGKLRFFIISPQPKFPINITSIAGDAFLASFAY